MSGFVWLLRTACAHGRGSGWRRRRLADTFSTLLACGCLWCATSGFGGRRTGTGLQKRLSISVTEINAATVGCARRLRIVCGGWLIRGTVLTSGLNRAHFRRWDLARHDSMLLRHRLFTRKAKDPPKVSAARGGAARRGAGCGRRRVARRTCLGRDPATHS